MRAVWPFPRKGGGDMTIAESFGIVFTSIGLTISALTLVVSMILVVNKKK